MELTTSGSEGCCSLQRLDSNQVNRRPLDATPRNLRTFGKMKATPIATRVNKNPFASLAVRLAKRKTADERVKGAVVDVLSEPFGVLGDRAVVTSRGVSGSDRPEAHRVRRVRRQAHDARRASPAVLMAAFGSCDTSPMTEVQDLVMPILELAQQVADGAAISYECDDRKVRANKRGKPQYTLGYAVSITLRSPESAPPHVGKMFPFIVEGTDELRAIRDLRRLVREDAIRAISRHGGRADLADWRARVESALADTSQ